MADRTAHLTWNGGLMDGSGTITGSDSGALSDLAVSWPARTEEHGGNTSPEELIAAAHASCFAMALSFGLANAGTPPQQLDVSATCTLDLSEAPKITSMNIRVIGKVDGLDQAGFEEAAKGAGEGCPVSGALKGNVEVNVTAELG